MDRTFVAIKPDAVQRGFIGQIIERFERKGFKIVGLKMLKPTRELAEKHYEEHIGRDYFERLVAFMISGPVIAMVVEGKNAVSVVRRMVGSTKPHEAEVGTIRFDFAQVKEMNIIHGSDSIENAKREIDVFFREDELVDWHHDLELWLYEK